jgi:tripartite-type tricarboxylate transporter receptor subunit TctC
VSQAEIVANGLPDGYTVLIDGNSFWIGPLIRQTPYDPVKDFSPIATLSMSPNILVIHPAVPANSVKELIALAKAKPGVLNYGSAAAGTATHLSTELLKSMANVNIVRVTYQGGGPTLTALLGGEVQLVFATATSIVQHIKSGRVRALAVTTAQPTALVPGLPTVAASGLPGYESIFMQGVWVPAKTPAAIVTRLNRELVRVLHSAEVKEKFFVAGSETVGDAPHEFAARMKSEMSKWGKVIKDAGITGE